MIFKAWLAIFGIWAIGAALLTLFCADLRRWHLAAKLGLSFGVGLTALTVSLFLASLIHQTPAPWIGVIELIVFWATALAAKRRRLSGWFTSYQKSSEPQWARTMQVMLVIFCVGIFSVFAAATLLEPIAEWDVMGIWALKAKVLLHEPAVATDYFHDLSKAYSHLDYPLLWPMAMAWIWSCEGQADLISVKVLAVALFGSTLLLFFGLLRRNHSRTTAILFTALLAGVPMLLAQTSRLMSDPLLAFFFLGSFVCAYFWLDSGQIDDLKIAGVLVIGMLFTKNEGVALWLILIFLVALMMVTKKQTQRLRCAAVWLALLPLFINLPWFIFRLGIAKVHEDYGGKINPAFFFNNVARLPEILSGWGRTFLNWHDWLILWPLGLSILLAAPGNCFRRPMIFLLLAGMLPLLLYTYVYVVSPWNLGELMEATENRLLLQVMPLWLFLFAEQFRTSRLLPIAAQQL